MMYRPYFLALLTTAIHAVLSTFPCLQVTGFLRAFSFPERIRESRSRFRQFEFLHQEAVVSC
jgi:hypothetical protein